jgi:hypothetical protein
MNPYDPPKEPPEEREPKVWLYQMSFTDFGMIVFVVVIGTPILYDTILELVEKIL